jgi:tRNA-uridine 2-sulfurtransferase
VVGPRAALAETQVALAELNWLGPPLVPGGELRVAAKLRSAQPPVGATLRIGEGDAELVLDMPAGAVAPGQAAVLYDGDHVLGGGWIRRPQAG